MRDLARELNEWDGEWPACWRPREGETLVGQVRRYSTGQSAYGPVRTVIVQPDSGAAVSIWLSSTVLLALFQQEKPQIGERIGVKYLGKHPQKGYKRYTLLVDRAGQVPDFSPLGGERGEAPDLGDEADGADPFACEEPERPLHYAAATLSGQRSSR